MKTLSFIFIFLCCAVSTHAQNKFDIDTTIVGGKEQLVFAKRAIYINSHNDKFIIGFFKGSCTIENTTIVTNSNLVSDMCRGIYIAKYADDDNFVWLKKICECDSIVDFYSTMDKSGNILLSLIYRSTLYKYNDTILNPDHLGDIIIMKIDSSGNEVFNKIIAGPCFQTINSIATDNSNNIFFSGLLDNNVNNCATNFDSLLVLHDTLTYLAKMDSNGTYFWVKKYTVDIIDELFCDNNELYCMGRCVGPYNDFDGLALNYPISYHTRCFLGQLDSAGNGLWVRRFGDLYNGGVGYVIPQNIRVLNNLVYFTATGLNQTQNIFLFEGGADLVSNVLANGEAFVAAYDKWGNFKWRNLAPDLTYMTGLATDSNSNVTGVGGDDFSLRMISFDSLGNFRWNASSFATELCNTPGSGIAKETNGKLYIVGASNCSNGLFLGNDTLFLPANQSTVFFASLDSIDILTPLGNAEFSMLNDELKVYPNPANTNVNIEILNQKFEARNQDTKLELINTLGQSVYSSQINRGGQLSYPGSHISIDISAYPNGIYFLTYKTERETVTKKLIIQH